MTEKRFTMDNPNDWGFPITDNVTGKVYNCNSNILMKDLCKVVNGIVDENEQLKKQWKEQRHEDINELSVIAMKYQALEKENEELKWENNELKYALALDEVDYIVADGKKIDIPPYYEFEQRYDNIMHRREYDGYD